MVTKFAFQYRRCSSTPGQGAKIPHATGPKKKQNIKQKQYATDSIKTLKMAHIKKKKNLKEKKWL